MPHSSGRTLEELQEEVRMALMRGFARVAADGTIKLPSNIRRELELAVNQLMEIKVQGPVQAPYLVINKRKQPR